MARSSNSQPTDGELSILQVLWNHGPCELGQVCAQLRESREIATTTVATILRVMLNKGLAKRAKGPNGWVWSANVSRRATAGQMLGKVLDHLFDGSAQMLMTHLIDGKDLSPDDLRELRSLLEARNPKGSSEGKAR